MHKKILLALFVLTMVAAFISVAKAQIKERSILKCCLKLDLGQFCYSYR